jgi:hypothetical protein
MQDLKLIEKNGFFAIERPCYFFKFDVMDKARKKARTRKIKVKF